jgi:hypothetical protein
MGQRYRVVLEVLSNFAGEPEADVEQKTIKSYLESVAGVGAISVLSVEPAPEPAVVPEAFAATEPPTKTVRKPRFPKGVKKV